MNRRFRSPGSRMKGVKTLSSQIVKILGISAIVIVSFLLFYTTRTSKSINESSFSTNSPSSGLPISAAEDALSLHRPAVVPKVINPSLPLSPPQQPPTSLRQRDPPSGVPANFNKNSNIHIPIRFDRVRFARVSVTKDAIGFPIEGIQSFGLSIGKNALLGDEACITPPPFGTQCTAHAEISMKLCIETPGCLSVTCPDKTPYFNHENKNIHGPVCQLRGLNVPPEKRGLEKYLTATSLEAQFIAQKTSALGVVFEGGHGMCNPNGCKNVFFSDELPRPSIISTFSKQIDAALVGVHDYDANQGVDKFPLLIIPFSQAALFTEKLKLDGLGRGKFVQVTELKAPSFVESLNGADAFWLYSSDFKHQLRNSPNFVKPSGPDNSNEWQHVLVFREDENADAPLM